VIFSSITASSAAETSKVVQFSTDRPGLIASQSSALTPWKPRPALGGQKTLVLLVQFRDTRFTSSVVKIRTLMDTVDEWFRRSSYGKMYIDYTVYEQPVTLPNAMSSYGSPKAGDQRGDDSDRTDNYIHDVLISVRTQTNLNLTRFRHVVLIHAGGDEAITGNPRDLWSLCDCAGPMVDEAPNEATWSLIDQAGHITHTFWGVSTFSENEPWSILAHEYAHSLGVTDLYVYGADGYSESAGVGFWSNMATGAFLDPPSDIDGWSKYILGWIQATTVGSAQGEYTLYTLDSQGEPKALLVKIPDSYGEYYFIHARRKAGTDAALPSEGVIVLRINPTLEVSTAGDELAMLSDANPLTPVDCGSYNQESVELCERLDAPYNVKGQQYDFNFHSLTERIVLDEDAFWAEGAGMGFKVQAVGDNAFRLTFSASPKELGISTTGPTSITGTEGQRCVVATAAFGSEMAEEVVRMRLVRDEMIGSTGAGRILVNAFNNFYYSWSPTMARAIAPNWVLRGVFRLMLLPVVWIVEVTARLFTLVNGVTGSGDAASALSFLLAGFLSVFCYIVLPVLIVMRTVRSIQRSWRYRMAMRDMH
jgi:M6 family metalloprotease-like protein